MYGRNSVTWKGDGLHVGGKGVPVVTIESDARFPSMWRVRLQDGRLSDLANRTRAKDAAASIALGVLNERLAA